MSHSTLHRAALCDCTHVTFSRDCLACGVKDAISGFFLFFLSRILRDSTSHCDPTCITLMTAD